MYLSSVSFILKSVVCSPWNVYECTEYPLAAWIKLLWSSIYVSGHPKISFLVVKIFFLFWGKQLITGLCGSYGILCAISNARLEELTPRLQQLTSVYTENSKLPLPPFQLPWSVNSMTCQDCSRQSNGHFSVVEALARAKLQSPLCYTDLSRLLLNSFQT